LGIQNISVILSPAQCTPSTFFTQNCKTPGTKPSSLSVLLKHGVNVGISVLQDSQARELIWNAGWAVSDLDLDLSDFEFAKLTVSMITVKHIFIVVECR
jgi:hypothetical protein